MGLHGPYHIDVNSKLRHQPRRRRLPLARIVATQAWMYLSHSESQSSSHDTRTRRLSNRLQHKCIPPCFHPRRPTPRCSRVATQSLTSHSLYSSSSSITSEILCLLCSSPSSLLSLSFTLEILSNRMSWSQSVQPPQLWGILQQVHMKPSGYISRFLGRSWYIEGSLFASFFHTRDS